MKSVLLLLLYSCLFVIGYSAVFQERQRIVPGHENECFEKEDNVFYKKGEEMRWKMKICGRKICKGANGRGFVFAEIQTLYIRTSHRFRHECISISLNSVLIRSRKQKDNFNLALPNEMLSITSQKSLRMSALQVTSPAEFFTTFWCGKVDVPPECHTEVDLLLPYPNCCEQIICPEILLNNTVPSH